MNLTRLRARTASVLLVVLALGAGVGSSPPAYAAEPTPAVPSGLPAGIEPLSGYVPATSCDPKAKPGTVALGRMLTSTYPGTTYGISRTCGAATRPSSEHYEGRAVDLMISVRDRKQAAQAKTLLSWLLVADAKGNAHANARRLGIMYIIWDDKMWSAYAPSRGWRPYSTCAKHPEPSWDNTCHRNHIHFSLTWPGALGTTSYWTKKVAPANYGTCRARDLNWAAAYNGKRRSTPCTKHPVVRPPAGASATLKTLTTYSGRRVATGETGPMVSAVQAALKVTRTGKYDARTRAAVKTFQTAHGLKASGTVTASTWRALLKDQAPTAG